MCGIINLADVKPPTEEQREAWDKYERGKMELIKINLPDIEYEAARRKLSRKYGIAR